MNDASGRTATLAIETSNPSLGAGAVAIGARRADGRLETLAVETLAPKSRHDEALAPAIDAAARRAGLSARDFGRIAVSIGPGGFTGLRVATATAKMIAEVAGAACVPVPTALVAASAILEQDGSIPSVAVVLASKRDTAWIAAIRRDASARVRWEASRNGRVMTAETFGALLTSESIGVVVADEHLPEGFREAAITSGVAMAPLRLGVETCLAVSWELPSVDPLELAPLYPREPEAVSKWREMHP